MIIAIIGPDGCGKTTQAKMLVESLNRIGYDSIYVHSNDVLFSTISSNKPLNLNQLGPRNFRKSKNESSKERHVYRMPLQIIASSLGFFYALFSYVYIKYVLDRNKIIVCDRYYYQFFNDLFGEIYGEKISRMFPQPEMIFLLDLDINLLYSRMIDKADRNIGKDYYIKLFRLYKKLGDDLNFIQIDSRLEKEKVNELIFNNVCNRLGDA